MEHICLRKDLKNKYSGLQSFDDMYNDFHRPGY
jgi:hypothetical protein